MTAQQKRIPIWILIVSGLFATMEIFVSFALYLMPESMAETVDIHAKGIEFLISMWVIRQFALGIIFAFATIKKSVPMLTIAYIFLLVMFLGDLMIGVMHKETGMIISTAVMCGISSAMLFALNKKK